MNIYVYFLPEPTALFCHPVVRFRPAVNVAHPEVWPQSQIPSAFAHFWLFGETLEPHTQECGLKVNLFIVGF